MAVPNPEKELERLQKRLAEGLPRFVLLTGSAGFFRGEAFELLLAAVPKDVDLRRIDGQEESDGRELQDLRGATLFGAGTAVAVRRGDAWLSRRGAELVEVLPKIKAGCALFVEATKLDGRTKLAKTLGAAGEHFEFRELYAEPFDRSRSPLDAELVQWVVARGRKLGVRLSPDAAFLVMSSVGKEPAELVAELKRPAGELPAGKTAGPDALRGKLTVSFESTPFEFADAMLAGDRRRAMRSLEAMFERGVKGRDGAAVDAGGVFPFTASWLWTAMSNAHAGRALLESGVRLDEIPGRVGVRTFVDRYRAQVEKNDEAQLRHALLCLLDAQRELRTSGEEPQAILERFVARCFARRAQGAGA